MKTLQIPFFLLFLYTYLTSRVGTPIQSDPPSIITTTPHRIRPASARSFALRPLILPLTIINHIRRPELGAIDVLQTFRPEFIITKLESSVGIVHTYAHGGLGFVET